VQHNVNLLRHCIELAVADPVVDLVIADQYPGEDGSPEYKRRQGEVNNFIIDFAKTNTYNKPLVVAMNMLEHNPDVIASGARLRREFALAGVPAYSSQANAARALARFIKYHEFQVENRDNS
jgi:acyl-CoA synthetase (NDP forming)